MHGALRDAPCSTPQIGVIPARYQSVRFPGKPLVKILGVPMVVRTWQQACLCKTLSKVIVATDDERIAEACSQEGAEVVMTSVSCANGMRSVHPGTLLGDRIRARQPLQGRHPDVAGSLMLNVRLLPLPHGTTLYRGGAAGLPAAVAPVCMSLLSVCTPLQMCTAAPPRSSGWLLCSNAQKECMVCHLAFSFWDVQGLNLIAAAEQ